MLYQSSSTHLSLKRQPIRRASTNSNHSGIKNNSNSAMGGSPSHSPNGSSPKVSLKKEFTVVSGVAVIVGQIIGSGIFVTPNTVFSYAGSFGLCMLLWIFGSIVAISGGLCYIELGLLVKRGGGESAYLREAYSMKKKNKGFELLGSMLGFLFVWSNICILRPASTVIQSLTCAHYITRSFYREADVPEYWVKGIALGIIGGYPVCELPSPRGRVRRVQGM